MSRRIGRKSKGALFALLVAASHSCVVIGEDPVLEPFLELQGDGVGSDPAADFSIDFGRVAIGSIATPVVFAFNPGSAKLTAQVEELGPGPFELGTRSFELAPRERRRLPLTMSPREVGSFETTLIFRTNERDPTRTVRLVGQGIESSLVCSPAEVDVGDVVRGQARTARISCTNRLATPSTIRLGNFVGTHQRSFAAELQGGDGVQVEILAGESIGVSIEFRADDFLGVATATLPIVDGKGQPLVSLPVRANAVEHALQVRYEENGERIPLVGCYRFPDTDIGEEVLRSLFVRNLGTQPVYLEELRFDTLDEHFSLVAPRLDWPLLVAPNGEEEVEIRVAFHPKSATQRTRHLVLHSDDPLEPVNGIRACLEGHGGGARISCTPAEVDFGPVAIGMSVTRRLTCHNTAHPPEATPPQILYVESATTTEPTRFRAAIRNDDGSLGPKPSGYLPGEGFQVHVTYTPGPDERTDVAEIVVPNTSRATPMHRTRIVGQGRALPPCVFDVSPQELRFGVVAPGSRLTLTSYVFNRTNSECLLSNLRLSDDSDPAFSLEEVDTAIIPRGERFPIRVTFAPTDAASPLVGAAEFFISDPTHPERALPLSGISREPCLELAPREIDFGGMRPGCIGREVAITLTNVCGPIMRIDDIHIDGAFSSFALHAKPPLPMELLAGDRMEFFVSLQPDSVDLFEGAVVLEASTPGEGAEAPRDVGPYTVPMKGEGRHEGIQTDSFTLGDTKVDVLWVVDNSESMKSLSPFLHGIAPMFMEFAIDQGIDFQVGVTSSGVASSPTSGCPGGFDGNEDGRLFPHPSLGRPRILRPSMPREQLSTHFAKNLAVGTCHRTPALYEAARRALSPPWSRTPTMDGGNLGFLRSDAALSIVLVTNGSDGGSSWNGDVAQDRSVQRYVDFFQGLKDHQGRKDAVKIHAISGGNSACTSNGSAEACPRCLEGPLLTGGAWLEACTQGDVLAWEDFFRQVLQSALAGGGALRGRPADWNADGKVDHHDMEVRVDGRLRPAYNASGAKVWRYVPESNAIAFDRMYLPAPTHPIDVTYKVDCMNSD